MMSMPFEFHPPRESPGLRLMSISAFKNDAVSLLHGSKGPYYHPSCKWDAEKKEGFIQRCKDTQESLYSKEYYQYDQLDNKMLAEGVLTGY
jgi:hypothetical protein